MRNKRKKSLMNQVINKRTKLRCDRVVNNCMYAPTNICIMREKKLERNETNNENSQLEIFNHYRSIEPR